MAEELTEADRRALGLLVAHAARFCKEDWTPTEVGEVLYGGVNRRGPGRNRQCYARPGGRIIARLLKAEYLVQTYRHARTRWERRAYVLTAKATSGDPRPCVR